MTVTRIKGPTILLRSGKYFDFDDPEHSEFDIVDIAHALAHICRYTGHCRAFYSVAQHSVLLSLIVPPDDALAGLLHDAAEAFIGDVSKPLKLLLPDYRRLEQRIESAVLGRFGISALPVSVKHADVVMLRTEQRDLMGADNHRWWATDGVQPLAGSIAPVGPEQARTLFLDRYAALVGGSHG